MEGTLSYVRVSVRVILLFHIRGLVLLLYSCTTAHLLIIAGILCSDRLYLVHSTTYQVPGTYLVLVRYKNSESAQNRTTNKKQGNEETGL